MADSAQTVLAWPAPDWQQPWHLPFAEFGRAVRSACEAGQSLPDALTRHGHPESPRFVPQAALPTGKAYEAFIFETRQVPTRDGLHDFFNGLVWMRFPQTKRRLNQWQAREISRAGVQQVRGSVRDAITLFDENAVLLQAPDEVWEALLARQWQRLLVDLRPLWRQVRVVLFGHALLEKLVAPYKSITGHVYREPVPLSLEDNWHAWDAWLAQRLDADALATKPFTPLPVLGIPGWCADNEHPAFYDDAGVFRPARPAVSRSLTG